MSGNRSDSSAETLNISITKVLGAPVEEVWKAWSESEYVMRWWGPRGFSCPVARMDFREGGTSLVCMRAPEEYGGQDMYNTWTYTRIDPHSHIEFVSHFADEGGRSLDREEMGLAPGIPNAVPHIVTLKATQENTTELTVMEYGYTSERARDMSEEGQRQCLEKMAELLVSD